MPPIGQYAGSPRLLRQLSGGQCKLRDCGSAGHSGAHESGKPWPRKTCSPVSPSGKDERPNRWRLTRRMGTGSSCSGWPIKHHSLYANPRQYSQKDIPTSVPIAFIYEPEHNRYLCPAGQFLNYGGRVYRNRAFNYIGTRKKCGPCSLRPQCTSAAFRGLIIHQNEPARQRARELVNTPEFAKAQRQRKKVEALFAELKNQIGLRRLRLRRLKFVREQFFLAAVAQNIKRLVRFLSQPTTPVLPATT